MTGFLRDVRTAPARFLAAGARGSGARRLMLYGLTLGATLLALQWLDYRRVALGRTDDLYIALIAGGFLALGIAVGMRVLGARAVSGADGNPRAVAALGISARELGVLRELAAGRSTAEIAERLGISPNTVKTHVARLFEKLEAKRRTDAVAKARALGILE